MTFFTPKTAPDTDIEDAVVQQKVWFNRQHADRNGINSKLIDDLIGAIAANQKKMKRKRPSTKSNDKKNGNKSD